MFQFICPHQGFENGSASGYQQRDHVTGCITEKSVPSSQPDVRPKAFARRAVASGRLSSEEEAVREALVLWEDRERRRVEFLATLDRARASLAQGEGRIITQESMRELSAEVREQGRARLIAQLANAS